MKAGIHMLFSRDIGIDLGTSNTKVTDKKGHIIINEPSVVAVNVKSKRVLETGNEAKNMIGRFFASFPVASTLFDFTSTATTDGSLIIICPFLSATLVFDVPRSIPISLEKSILKPAFIIISYQLSINYYII